MKVAIDGGTPITLTDVATSFAYGLSWEPDGTLLYGQVDGIWRVSQNGGVPVQLVKTEAPEQLYGPRLLPGGQWLLFTITKATGSNRWNEADIVIQSLASGERRIFRSSGFDARYLPTGHITYMEGNVLLASTFDAATLKLGDERVPVVQDVRTATTQTIPVPEYAPSDGGGVLLGNPNLADGATQRRST